MEDMDLLTVHWRPIPSPRRTKTLASLRSTLCAHISSVVVGCGCCANFRHAKFWRCNFQQVNSASPLGPPPAPFRSSGCISFLLHISHRHPRATARVFIAFRKFRRRCEFHYFSHPGTVTPAARGDALHSAVAGCCRVGSVVLTRRRWWLPAGMSIKVYARVFRRNTVFNMFHLLLRVLCCTRVLACMHVGIMGQQPDSLFSVNLNLN